MKGTNTCRTLRIWIYWGFPCSSLGLLGDGRPSEECNILYYILGSALLRTDYAGGEDGREGGWRRRPAWSRHGGEAAGEQEWGSPSPGKVRNQPLISWAWVLEFSLLSPPGAPPSSPCLSGVGSSLGLPSAWRGASPTATPLSPMSGWVLPRGRSCSRGPLWG